MAFCRMLGVILVLCLGLVSANACEAQSWVDTTYADTSPAEPFGTAIDSLDPVSVSQVGIATGLTQWPLAKWAAGPLNGTRVTMLPSSVLNYLSSAKNAHMRIEIALPRNKMTKDGTNTGLYDQAKAFKAVDDLRAVLTPAKVAYYADTTKTLIDMMVIDEPGAKIVWGGVAVTQKQVDSLAKYVKSKWPRMPTMVRSKPSWFKPYTGWNKSVDVSVVVWTLNRGDAKTLWDTEWAIAQSLGLNMEPSINAHNCDGLDNPCSATVLKSVGKIALDHPSTCAFLNYKYDSGEWGTAALRDAWIYLANYALGKPTRDCRRVN